MVRDNRLSTLRNILGGSIFAVTAAAAAFGAQWGWGLFLGGFALGLFLILGFGRLLRPGVSRTSTTEILCRYVPWYEGNAYGLCVLLPLMGASILMRANAGKTVHSPGLLQFVGVGLLLVAPIAVWSVARLWRRCSLLVGRSELTVGVIKPGPVPIVISRNDIDAINTTLVSPGLSGIFNAPQIEIAYRSDNAQAPSSTIQIGPDLANSRESGLQLSVKPENLERALAVWKEGSADDPELLDRVEAILCGR